MYNKEISDTKEELGRVDYGINHGKKGQGRHYIEYKDLERLIEELNEERDYVLRRVENDYDKHCRER